MPSARASYRRFHPNSELTDRQINRRIVNDVHAADPSGKGRRVYPTNHTRGGESSFFYTADSNDLGIIVGMITHQEARRQGYLLKIQI